jgi:hypothetical protein
MNEAQLVALAEMLRNQPDGVLQSQSNQSVRRLRAADAVHAIVERGSRASLSANADASGNMGGVGADGRASGVMTPLPVREVRLKDHALRLVKLPLYACLHADVQLHERVHARNLFDVCVRAQVVYLTWQKINTCPTRNVVVAGKERDGGGSGVSWSAGCRTTGNGWARPRACRWPPIERQRA